MIINTNRIILITIAGLFFIAAVGICTFFVNNSMSKMQSMDGMTVNMECCVVTERPEIQIAFLHYHVPEIFKNAMAALVPLVWFISIVASFLMKYLNNFYLYILRSRLSVRIGYGLLWPQRALRRGIIHPKLYELSFVLD